MRDEQWCVKSLSKCESWLDKVIFLGYIAFKEGIFFYESKDIKVNVAWERSTNVMEVKKKFVCFIRLLMMHCGRTIYGSEYYIYE